MDNDQGVILDYHWYNYNITHTESFQNCSFTKRLWRPCIVRTKFARRHGGTRQRRKTVKKCKKNTKKRKKSRFLNYRLDINRRFLYDSSKQYRQCPWDTRGTDKSNVKPLGFQRHCLGHCEHLV